MDAVVISAGGEGPALVPRDIADARRVVAADSGYDLARTLGLRVDCVVGDLDSISAEGLDHARSQGIRIVEYPADKDRTDLELAIDECVDAGTDRLVVIGGRGGRLDHQLAVVSTLAQLSRPPQTPMSIEAWMGESVLFVVDDRWEGSVAAGATVSLLAWNGTPRVTASGVRWPLDDEILEVGEGRGVSNVALGGPLRTEVDGGTVLLIVDNGETLS